MSVKPQAWSLKQRRANLIWVNSGALRRWIKHFFSLMLPGLIKSQIPPLSSVVTQYRNPCAGWNRKDEVSYCISSALGTRRDNRTMWRYTGRGNACRRVPLDQFFWWMMHCTEKEKQKERKRKKANLRFHLPCTTFNCAKNWMCVDWGDCVGVFFSLYSHSSTSFVISDRMRDIHI